MSNPFTQSLGIEVPVICGAMYPCSNPELVAAASRHGGIGVIQPISLTYVHGYDFREGVKKIRELAEGKPLGLNLLIEASSKNYLERNRQWLEIALEEGVRFFVTALGDPSWVIKQIQRHQVDAVVYHDVTERKWAQKALVGGVHGLICVNNRAGGHAGHLSPQQLYDSLRDLGVPLVCAGGISSGQGLSQALRMGYAAVQMGTRFIATEECTAHQDYKQAILDAEAKDIVLTRKITGVPVSIIKTAYVERMGIQSSPLINRFLDHPKTKHLMRLLYSLKSIWQLKRSYKKGSSYREFFQAGKSVDGIVKIEAVKDVMDSMRHFAES